MIQVTRLTDSYFDFGWLTIAIRIFDERLVHVARNNSIPFTALPDYAPLFVSLLTVDLVINSVNPAPSCTLHYVTAASTEESEGDD